MRKNILITGLPRSGKSSLLNKVILGFPRKIGLVTNEVREDGERTGFEIETSTGKKALLASTHFDAGPKVSRYFVNAANLDSLLPEISDFKSDDLLYLDEIGQMELFSDEFKKIVMKFLDSPNICLATLSKVYSDDFTESIRVRKNVVVVEITEENRDSQQEFIEQLVSKIKKAKNYISHPEIFKFGPGEVEVLSEHGPRHILISDNKLICDCDFFKLHGICSHVIAAEKIISKRR